MSSLNVNGSSSNSNLMGNNNEISLLGYIEDYCDICYLRWEKEDLNRDLSAAFHFCANIQLDAGLHTLIKGVSELAWYDFFLWF